MPTMAAAIIAVLELPPSPELLPFAAAAPTSWVGLVDVVKLPELLVDRVYMIGFSDCVIHNTHVHTCCASGRAELLEDVDVADDAAEVEIWLGQCVKMLPFCTAILFSVSSLV